MVRLEVHFERACVIADAGADERDLSEARRDNGAHVPTE